MREHGIKWGSKAPLDLDFADSKGILGENVSKVNEFLEILRGQATIIGLKINIKKT